VNARRGPARHAAARVMPGRRRDRDGRETEDDVGLAADPGYEWAGPPPSADRTYPPSEPRAYAPAEPPAPAQPRAHAPAEPPAGARDEPSVFDRAEPRVYQQAGPSVFDRAEPRVYQQAEPPAHERAEPPPATARRPAPAAAPDPRRDREAWLRRGQMQFDYLIGHGLQSGDRLLEIGCGTLAAGHLFIDYLSAGNYYGVEFSPEAVIAAQQTITEFGLQAKLPHVTLAGDFTLGFLPSSRFTVVQADGVFSRAPIEAIGECLAHVTRVMTADAIFDFTFNRAAGDTLIGLAGSHGLDAELMEDWEQLGNTQPKLRVTRPN
jgi:SAM-dependent methyltransferase